MKAEKRWILKVAVSLWKGLETPVFCFNSHTSSPKSPKWRGVSNSLKLSYIPLDICPQDYLFPDRIVSDSYSFTFQLHESQIMVPFNRHV